MAALNFQIIVSAFCAVLSISTVTTALKFEPITTKPTPPPVVDDGNLPIYKAINACINAAPPSVSFDVLIDIAKNPQTSDQDQKAQHSNQVTQFFGKYFGPIFIDYIKRFVGKLEKNMDNQQLYTVILDNGIKYYYNESSTDYNVTTDTKDKENESVGKKIENGILHLGSDIANVFHHQSGSQVSGKAGEAFDPIGFRLPKITNLALRARSNGQPLTGPPSKPSTTSTLLTIVLTDGVYANMSTNAYPSPSLILDIGGGWSASQQARKYVTPNVLLVEHPQDLESFTNNVRFVMCQALGGLSDQHFIEVSR